MAKTKDKENKTNVMRILEQQKEPYTAHYYEHPTDSRGDVPVDGATVARLLGQNPAQVFKTLVTQGASREYRVFVIPVEKELDLKAAARSVGEKSVEMIPVAQINAVTGYIRGGCSPIGLKKPYRVTLDESALAFPTILFSAGKIGAQVEVSPTRLLRILSGQTADISV